MRLDLAIAAAPAVLLVALFQHLDRKRPEPTNEVYWVVLLGALTCIPAAIIEVVLSLVLGSDVVKAQGSLVESFVVAAFTEELVKLAVVMLYLWRKRHFDEVMDGILYTAASSLGFALLENLLYSVGRLELGFLRAFTAVPLHAICSGIMGYCVGRARLAKQGVAGWLLLGFAAAVTVHGFYDWTVFSGGGFGILEPDALRGLAGVVPLLGVCGFVLFLLIRHALRLDDELLGPAPRPGAYPPAPAPGYPPYGPPPYGQQAATPGYPPPYGPPAPPPGYPPPYGPSTGPAGYGAVYASPAPAFGAPGTGEGRGPFDPGGQGHG